MVCSSCGRATKAGARFCGGCGTSLAPRCPACGAESEPDLRFCEACGASLAPGPAEGAAARKVVTIVFADLVGSTALHERLDAESVRQFMEGYYAAMRGAVEAHGGRVTQLMGDGVKAVFGAPRVAEDDAIRAVRAGVEMQRAFRALAEQQRGRVGQTGLRVAVNTGEVVADDDTEIIGDPVNVAARLQERGRDGDVVIGGSTQRLVASLVTLDRLGSFALKGRSEPVEAYRVVSLEPPAGVKTAAFVGRDEELARLAAVYDTAVAKPAARLAVVLGSPGLGKSRLLAELARRLGERASVLTAQCNPAGGATFAPLAEALRAHLGLEAGGSGDALRAALDAKVSGEDAERARIASGVGALLAGTPASPEETFFVVRRLLSALATERPLVLAIDDVQWAEPLLLDFTEHLVQWGAGIPLLVLAAARPELRETRSSLTTAGGLVSDVVTLTGLDAGAAMRLAGNVIGTDTLPASVAGRVLTASEGNPLFLGELVRMLVNDGVLRKEGERWSLAVDVAELDMPPTIQALLAARLERLRPEERLVLERAAVVGRQFSRAAITHLLPREAHADLDARLEALRRSELIEADAGWLLGEPALRFHHVLIRDAAYRRVLRGTRAELHARFADWLEARAPESAPPDETLGWHLEQAHQQLHELGPLDANGRALGERAARSLAAAGRAALARDDLQPAASLLGRALACLDDADPARADLALDWCEALLSAGDVAHAARALAELARFTAGSERLSAWHTCFSGQLAALADPKALRASAAAVAAAAARLAAAGDVAGEAKAHHVHADALARLGEIGACEAALDKALAAARRVRGDRRRANAVLAGIPVAALSGPSPVTRASGRCLDVVRVLRITEGAPAVEAVALRCQAVLETLRGRSDAARRMIASSRRMVEELGITQRLLEADLFAGLIELLEDDAAAAERWLRTAYDGFREHGLSVAAAQAAAQLGRALLAQGRAAEAEALSHESEALAGDDFKAAIAWRGVRAEALAGRGEHAAAVELARAAVEIAAATDDPLDHADARSALAVALRAAGRSGEADAETARAIELWEQKGATLLVERARRGEGRVAPVERGPETRVEPPRAERRRVRPNAAIANAARLDAAIAARDEEALPALLADEVDGVDHLHTRWDRQALLSSWRSLLLARDPICRYEPLATLGDSLALGRLSISGSGWPGRTLDVGPYQREEFLLVGVDVQGRRCWAESLAPDRLRDAVARLYERYAELLPEGPERARAAATARSVAALLDPPDVERYRAAIAPGAEYVDHRTLGLGSAHGADRILRGTEALLEVAENLTTCIDDVLALQADALLVRRTNFGSDRVGGGAYERPFLLLLIFGADGLLSRWEHLDADRDADALARFDELSAGLPPAIRRPVRPNHGTARADRFNAVFAARDADALPALLSDGLQLVHHPTGATLGPQELLAFWRLPLAQDRDIAFQVEPVATLGPSLVLFRQCWSGSGYSDAAFEVGPYQRDAFSLADFDAEGRAERLEVFAPDRLGDAIARLYERHAELLPDGPERARAAAMARSVAVMTAMDPDRCAGAFAADIESIDHRIYATWSALGAEAVLQHLRSVRDLSEDYAARDQELLALRSDAYLVRRTTSGTARAGGGAFERPYIGLFVFGPDGLVTRWEQFDVDHDADALARFDELTAEPPLARPIRRRVRPNAATAQAARFDAAVAERDADVIPTLLAEDSEVVDHTNGSTYGGPRQLEHYRRLLRTQGLHYRHEPVATLGDSLALFRLSISGSGAAGRTFDVGAFDFENVVLVEVDSHGRRRRQEIFASDRLGDALARLYERYADLLPDGPECARAVATARSVAGWVGPYDIERAGAPFASAVEQVDHRTLGTWSARGREALLEHMRALIALAEGIVFRNDDVLDVRPDALLVQRIHRGTDRTSGGAYERPFLILLAFDADGLVTRQEMFDADRDAEALARFDELAAEPPRVGPFPRRVRANLATANVARTEAAIGARDAGALPALLAGECEIVDHTSGLSYGGPGLLASWRSLLDAREPQYRNEPSATLGDVLVVCRHTVSASGLVTRKLDIGAYETVKVILFEVEADARLRRGEIFALDRLGDAITRLYERYAELLPEGPERVRAAATARSVAVWSGPLDLDRLAASLARAVECIDHRILGTWSARGAEEFELHWRAQFDVTDANTRDHEVLALDSDALLVRRTWFGTARFGGGAFENANLVLLAFGADGLVARVEVFDADRDAEALARFDELTAAPPPPRPISRRVRANLATANAARTDAAIAARDAGALPALVAGECDVLDHTTGTPYDRSGILASWRSLFGAREPRYRQEPLATLGDRLALCRHSVSASGLATRTLDIGAYETEKVVLLEVEADGRLRRTEAFALDRLGDAVARLYERYAELLPDGPERTRAAVAARLFAAVQTYDLDRVAAALAPDVEYVDHRAFGFPRTRGAEAYMRRLGSLWEVATDVRARIDDVLALGADACLVRWVNSGTDRAGGGAFEVPFFLLWVFGADGLVTHNEPFDIGHEAEALARFDELTAASPPTPFANAAWRAVEALDRAMEQRDWDALVALEAPELVMDDRRSLVRTRVEGEASLANLRLIFDSWRSLSRQLLATRGQRLALDRQLRTSVDRHGGLAEFEYLCLNELDATGRIVVSVMFDLDDLDAAYAELDARYEATRKVPFLRAVAARDWDAVAALLAPDFVSEDHRLLGRGTLHGAAAYVALLRTLPELAPDARLRVEHMEFSGRGALSIAAVRGTWEGGLFETPVVVVSELDPQGRVRRIDSYDLDQLGAARAHFATLAAPPAAPWLENAATRASHAVHAAWETRDWVRFAAIHAPGFRRIDRRRSVQLDLDRAVHLEFVRPLFEMESPHQQFETIATRGDRLGLHRYRFEGTDRDVGPSVIEWVGVSEVDAQGDRILLVVFDPDDLDAAYAELDERYGTTKVTTCLLQGIAARDWGAVASLLAPDFLVDDHRLLGWGTLHGPAFLDLLKALVELAPDARLRFDHLEDSSRGAFGISMLAGTREGGAFEDRRVVVSELDAEGKVRRFEFYDLERLDEARTRFDAIANAPRDPLAALVKPNAATAALDRLQAAFDARDWAALRALAAEGARFEDRRRHARVAGDVDWWIADLKRVAAEAYVEDVHYQRTLVATAGDRVCLERVLLTGGPADGRIEVETLTLAEIDAAGRLVAIVVFDVDDSRAAIREASSRWLARDPAAAAIVAPLLELIDANNDRDRARMRAVLADDLVLDDRRLAGRGEVAGADALLHGVAVLWGLAPDIQTDPRSVLALERHGLVALLHGFGTLSDGGGAFERFFVSMATVARGRVTRLEHFELEAADIAVARLAELRPDPLRIPPNAATRASELRHAAWQARDWDALRALASPDFRFEDRSRISQVSGGVEMWIENNRFVEPAGGERELIGTAGDRISLERVLWRGEPDGAPVEREHLRLTEVDAEGRIRASFRFDPEDRAAAFAEAGARFTAGEAAAVGGQARIQAFASATRQHDWEACRSCLAEDFVLRDRRAPGVLGTLDRDQWVESLRAAVDLATDFNFELVRILTWNSLGRVHQARMVGTRGGGPFESTFLSVMLVDRDRIQRNELFDVADTDRALARFEELCAAAAAHA